MHGTVFCCNRKPFDLINLYEEAIIHWFDLLYFSDEYKSMQCCWGVLYKVVAIKYCIQTHDNICTVRLRAEQSESSY